MACAELLASGWTVCWEMITGDVAADKLPRGVSRLAPVDMARSLTPQMVSSLQARQLHARFSLPPPSREAAQPRAYHLRDVSERLLRMGIRPPHIVGQLWGLRVDQGGR
jgi:hypothetical protein